MDADLAAMIADDVRTGPGADLGVTVTFEKSNKRGRQAFSVSDVPVSGIPYAESGKIDADFDNWTAQAVLPAADCDYRPDVGQTVLISTGPAAGLRCRLIKVQPDPAAGIYALDMEPIARG